jgi:putative oxidoreductase
MVNTFVRDAVVPLLLRLGLAAVFLYHGSQLVSKNLGAGWAPDLPVPAQVAAAWGQLLGGVAMLIGLLTRLAALGLIVIMAGAIALVHAPNGFDIRHGGWEYNFVLIVVCVAVILLGSGLIGVDRWLRFRRRPRV